MLSYIYLAKKLEYKKFEDDDKVENQLDAIKEDQPLTPQDKTV